MRGKTGKKRARSATTVRHTRRMKRKGSQRKIKSADTFPYSPISSPGSPDSPKSLPSMDSPITHRAKELARLYPNRKTMLQRSKSFESTGMTNQEFFAELERLLGTENVPYSPKRRI